MNQSCITAVFKGEDQSLGFKHGTTYRIKLEIHCSGKVVIYHPLNYGPYPTQTVPYGSFRAFLENWKDLSNTNPF